jgi:hypothetical protein
VFWPLWFLKLYCPGCAGVRLLFLRKRTGGWTEVYCEIISFSEQLSAMELLGCGLGPVGWEWFDYDT